MRNTETSSEMNTNQINRYNADGSENLDFWFGVRENRNLVINTVNKPQYVRYTLENLKKRSTARLEKMYFNTFGSIDKRQNMINRLFVELNRQWNDYSELIRNMFVQKISDGKRGRKPKFSYRDVVNMIADREFNEMTVTEIAKKYNTNIATVSQTLNGIGTYAYMFEDDYADELEIIQMMS